MGGKTKKSFQILLKGTGQSLKPTQHLVWSALNLLLLGTIEFWKLELKLELQLRKVPLGLKGERPKHRRKVGFWHVRFILLAVVNNSQYLPIDSFSTVSCIHASFLWSHWEPNQVENVPCVYFTTAWINTIFNHSIPCTGKGEYGKVFVNIATTHGKCQDFNDTHFQNFPSSECFPLVDILWSNGRSKMPSEVSAPSMKLFSGIPCLDFITPNPLEWELYSITATQSWHIKSCFMTAWLAGRYFCCLICPAFYCKSDSWLSLQAWQGRCMSATWVLLCCSYMPHFIQEGFFFFFSFYPAFKNLFHSSSHLWDNYT